MDRILLECEYFPCISWYRTFNSSANVCIEQEEHFVRASLRNRCYIAGTHGVLCLSVPIEGGRNQKIKMKDVRVSNHDRWQHVHWHSIFSSYGRSPYFQYFSDILEKFYQKKFTFLLDLNLASVACIQSMLRQSKSFALSSDFQPYTNQDLRLKIRSHNYQQFSTDINYHQVFSEQYGFIPNLSMLDFIFCEQQAALL